MRHQSQLLTLIKRLVQNGLSKGWRAEMRSRLRVEQQMSAPKE